MDGFWRGLWQNVKVAFSTFFAFMAGKLSAEREQVLADEKQKNMELRTDAKNSNAVNSLSRDERINELRNPPKP